MSETTLQAVDPQGAARPASDVLTAAWPAPALSYSESYLRWQLTFPGADGATPVAVAAIDRNRWVGFAAATPRRVTVADRPCWVHLVSFVGVRPEARGRRLASALYQCLLERLLAQSAVGVVTFAQENSLGLAALESAYRRAGYDRVELGVYRPLGMMLRPDTGSSAGDAAPPGVPAVDPQALVANAPDGPTWRHYLADPRKPRWAGTDTPGEGALLVQAQRATARGLEPFVLLANVFGRPPNVTSLARWTTAVVTVAAGATRFASWPNPAGVEPEAAKSCGWRVFPGAYQGFLFLRPGQSEVRSSGYTNLEVS